MNANKMRSEFDLKLDIFTSSSTPGLEDSEVSSLLTDGQANIVRDILNPDEDKLLDLTELARKQLSTLYVNGELAKAATQTGIFTNGIFWDIPTNHYVTLNLQGVVSSATTCLNGIEVNVKPVTYDEYNTNIKNPFRNPGRGVIWSLQAGLASSAQRIQTVNSSEFTDITKLRIAYIKKPLDIVVDVSTPADQVNSDLPDILHSRIVDEAVELAKLQLGLLNEFQAQTMYNEVNK